MKWRLPVFMRWRGDWFSGDWFNIAQWFVVALLVWFFPSEHPGTVRLWLCWFVRFFAPLVVFVEFMAWREKRKEAGHASNH